MLCYVGDANVVINVLIYWMRGKLLYETLVQEVYEFFFSFRKNNLHLLMIVGFSYFRALSYVYHKYVDMLDKKQASSTLGSGSLSCLAFCFSTYLSLPSFNIFWTKSLKNTRCEVLCPRNYEIYINLFYFFVLTTKFTIP